MVRFTEDYFYRNPEYEPHTIANALNRPVTFVNDNQYHVELIAGAIHPDNGWIAWLEYVMKDTPSGWVDCNYYLKARNADEIIIDWTVKTYNPFFGCNVGYLAWHDDKIVMIYSEKHCAYGVTLSTSGVESLAELGMLGSQFCIADEVVIIQSFKDGALAQFEIMTWKRLDNISYVEGKKMGILTDTDS